MRAELDGLIDKATNAAAPILERIALQQHGMSSERDLAELAAAVFSPIRSDPAVSEDMKIAGAQALASLVPSATEEARRAGKLLVDQPDPAPGGVPGAAAAAAMDGRGESKTA